MPASVGRALADLRHRFPHCHSVAVAYSGGRDSHVLLHAARAALDLPLRAIHVHHGLQPAAAAWPAHCAAVCTDLGMPLRQLEVAVADTGQGPEAAARDARYHAFAAELGEGELLLLGHHAGDQAETLLLRLARGTGLRGLGGMPPERAIGRGQLWRPLLALEAEVLADYAHRHQLRWVEDPSNADPRFDRNYLRAQVLAPLTQRWPRAAAQLAGAARRAAEAEALLDELLAPQLAALQDEAGALDAAALLRQPERLQSALLRAWLAPRLPKPPSEAQLRAMLREVAGARRDADPVLRLGDGALRRHRDRLYWVEPPRAVGPATLDWCDPAQPVDFGDQRLSLESSFGRRLALPAGAALQLRRRGGGERIGLRAGSRPLKKALQEAGVPSWLRARAPLLYVDGELAAVWGFLIATKFQKSE